MIKTMVLVPIADNDGKAFGPQDWAELEQQLLQAFGGWTDGGVVKGAWADGETVYRDTSRRFEVALGSWIQLPAWLELVRWIREHFRQISVYVEVAGIPEIIGE